MPDSQLQLAWCIAAWRPRFTEYLHRYVNSLLEEATSDSAKQKKLATAEHYVGQVVNAAIADGLDVRGVKVSDEPFLDIGTPETLSVAMRRFLPNH
jgi:glucose-1-phosphate thymidylyltransferase